MNELRQKIEALLQNQTGRFAVTVANLSTQEKLELNAEAVFASASMIKVPIMYEIMRQVAEHKLSLNQTLVVNDHVRVDGGILQELRPNIDMTIQELVTLMIVLSDNTATNLLINLIGMDCVNRTMAGLGLKSTLLRRKMMDFEAAKAGRENLISANDLALLFQIIYSGQGLPPEYGTLMLNILEKQQIRDKLPFYWPEEVRIAHKTGTLPQVEHDGGILYLSGGPYIACFLSDGLAENYMGLHLGAQMGKVIYEHFQTSC